MIISYDGIYKELIKKCYISEGYTDFNDLVVVLKNGTTLSNNHHNNSFIFEENIDKLIKIYIDGENESLIRRRKLKIDKLTRYDIR